MSNYVKENQSDLKDGYLAPYVSLQWPVYASNRDACFHIRNWSEHGEAFCRSDVQNWLKF